MTPMVSTTSGLSAKGEGLFNPANAISISYSFEDVNANGTFKTRSVNADSLGNFYVHGSFNDGSYNGGGILIKYNSSFVQQWFIVCYYPNSFSLWAGINGFCPSTDGSKIYLHFNGNNSSGNGYPVYEPQVMCISSTSPTTIYWSTAMVGSYYTGTGSLDSASTFKGNPVCDSSGNVYVAYNNQSYRTGNSRVGYTSHVSSGFVKLNSSGSVVLNTTVGSTSVESFITSLAISPDGNYIAMAGYLATTAPTLSYVYVYNQSLGLVFTGSYYAGGSNSAVGGSVCFDPTSSYCYFMLWAGGDWAVPAKISLNGGAAYAGTITNGYNIVDSIGLQLNVAKKWVNYTTTSAISPQMVCDSSGNIYFLGYNTGSTAGLPERFYIAKLDSNFNTLWIRQFQQTSTTTNNFAFLSIYYTSKYGILVGGFTTDTVSNSYFPYIINIRPTGVINNSTTVPTTLNSSSSHGITTSMISVGTGMFNTLSARSEASISNYPAYFATASSGDNYPYSLSNSSSITQFSI